MVTVLKISCISQQLRSLLSFVAVISDKFHLHAPPTLQFFSEGKYTSQSYLLISGIASDFQISTTVFPTSLTACQTFVPDPRANDPWENLVGSPYLRMTGVLVLRFCYPSSTSPKASVEGRYLFLRMQNPVNHSLLQAINIRSTSRYLGYLNRFCSMETQSVFFIY